MPGVGPMHVRRVSQVCEDMGPMRVRYVLCVMRVPARCGPCADVCPAAVRRGSHACETCVLCVMRVPCQVGPSAETCVLCVGCVSHASVWVPVQVQRCVCPMWGVPRVCGERGPVSGPPDPQPLEGDSFSRDLSARGREGRPAHLLRPAGEAQFPSCAPPTRTSLRWPLAKSLMAPMVSEAAGQVALPGPGTAYAGWGPSSGGEGTGNCFWMRG